MKTLNYSIDINAPKRVVWEKMLAPKTYKIWTKVFSENSTKGNNGSISGFRGNV
jgi:hypothetical protein